jgi:hypothetical protein
VNLDAYAQPKISARVAVKLPSRFAGAATYQVTAGCTSGTTPEAARTPTIAIDARCLVEGTYDVSARALDANGHPLAYSYRADLPASAEARGASTATTAIELPAWRTDFFAIELNVHDPAPDAMRSSATIDPEASELTMRGDAWEAPFPRRMLVPSALAERLGLTFVEQADHSSQRMISRLDVRSSSIDLDTNELLPRIRNLAWKSDGARTTLQFDLAEADADGAWIGMSWGAPKPHHNWTFVGPPHVRRVQTPELPAALSAWLPSGPPRSAVVTMFDRASIEDWSQVRVAPTDSMRSAVVRGAGERALRFTQARR